MGKFIDDWMWPVIIASVFWTMGASLVPTRVIVGREAFLVAFGVLL